MKSWTARKVSVVVPVYNAEKYLGQCMDSLLNQTYRNIELLCVDDGSTDGSPDILKGYAGRDPRVRIFTKRNEGRGAASARNLGLENATGDYVQFLDSDDFFEPDMIEALVGRIGETDADVVIYRADRYDDRLGRVVGPYESIRLEHAPEKDPFCYRDCPERIFQVGDVIAWNKIYRRSLLMENGMRFEPIAISDDQYIPAISLVLAERISCVDRCLLHYRFNTGHSQMNAQPRHPEAAYAATFAIVNKMRECGIYGNVRKSYLNMVLRLMREYFDKMTSLETVRFLYRKYRDEVFPALDAEGLTEDFFYDPRIWEWYELVTGKPLDEILFLTMRAYGADRNTAILRFPVPFDRIPGGARVVLVGKGIAGRYWYAQLLLSGHCDVVQWLDDAEGILEGMQYDMVLETK